MDPHVRVHQPSSIFPPKQHKPTTQNAEKNIERPVPSPSESFDSLGTRINPDLTHRVGEDLRVLQSPPIFPQNQQ